MSDVEEITEEGPEPIPRIFINYVDTFSAGAIAKIISQSAPGASRMELEEEEEEEVDEGEPKPPKNSQNLFPVCGTLLNPDTTPAFPVEIVKNEDGAIQTAIMASDIIIYSIAEGEYTQEAQTALDFLQQEAQHFVQPKTFILVSTCLTWLKTKHLDPDDPEIPFTEDDYRKRRTTNNFKDHIALEKLAIKLGRTNKKTLSCYVVCSGINYGNGENMLHWLFKQAWHGAASLPVYGTGSNVIPLIHVRDLASIVLNVLDSKPKRKYILAVDQSHYTLRDIVKRISQSLTTGKIHTTAKEDAQASHDVSQMALDALSADIHMEGVMVREEMSFKWVCEEGLIERLDDVVAEYKNCRGLLPVRITLIGPPGVGKTQIAKDLAAHYKIHHITTKELVEESIAKLEEILAKGDEPNPDEDEEEDDATKVAEAEGLLQSIKESQEQNDGRLDDSMLIRLFRLKLKSKPVLNQGCVLDGFPKTYEQAKALYEEVDEDGEALSNPDPQMAPEMVIDLTATEEFLKHRMMSLPEEVVQGTHNTEEGFLRRLLQFGQLRAEEDTVLHWFDEQEIDPIIIDVTQNNDEENGPILALVKKTIGSPRNYGLTPEEKEEEAKNALAEQEAKDSIQRALKSKRELQERLRRKKNLEVWTKQLEEVRKQEAQMLEERAKPFRQYIAAHVMPTLTAGLIECSKIRPEDPIDFLAEYLYQHNPALE